MRITVNIEDGLYQTAKCKAAERNITLSAFVEEAIHLYLVSQEKPQLKIPTAGKGGLQPGVDLDQSAILVDIMEGRS